MRRVSGRVRRAVIGARMESDGPVRFQRRADRFHPGVEARGRIMSTLRTMTGARPGPTLLIVSLIGSWRLEDHRYVLRGVSATGLAIGGIAISLRTDPRPGGHGAGLVVSVALGALVVGLLSSVVNLEAPARRLIPLVAVLAAGSFTLLWVQQRGNAGLPGAGTILMIAAARLFQRPRVLAAVTVAVVAVVTVEAQRRTSLAQSVVLCCPIVAVCLMMAMFQRLRDAKCKAQALLAELEQSRDAQARAAAMAERQHLAREMHDVLAHSLSGLMLQLEGARMLARAAPDDPRLPEVVNRAHELAKDGLAEARHAIGMLRGEQLPGPDAISTLTCQFEQHSGIPCTFAAAGPPRTVPPDARLAVYRVTQEALTNVVKHARAARVEVRLTYAADEVLLSVEDFDCGDEASARAVVAEAEAAAAAAVATAAASSGKTAPRLGAETNTGTSAGSGTEASAGVKASVATDGVPALIPAHPATGYGLTGMRERAELLGGTLSAGATGAGFRVVLRVPV
ncbi:signal transduction histidine kinase [Catenulispora sp. GAS73]|uniref:sensor histidine kinase n=1 Tax=Catenulispora sp. GAS73 TaxID=3156269 RepID=UPI00351347A7